MQAERIAGFKYPAEGKPLLLLSCCAPCCGGIMRDLKAAGIETTVLFYAPNIHPQAEYTWRKTENKQDAKSLNIPFVDLDSPPADWESATAGLESEPEKGKRCEACFTLRLEKTAEWAVENGFPVFSSTLGISRFKDMDQVNACGRNVAEKHPTLTYWPVNWRKKDGLHYSEEVARNRNFRRQTYCGCRISRKKALQAGRESS